MSLDARQGGLGAEPAEEHRARGDLERSQLECMSMSVCVVRFCACPHARACVVQGRARPRRWAGGAAERVYKFRDKYDCRIGKNQACQFGPV